VEEISQIDKRGRIMKPFALKACLCVAVLVAVFVQPLHANQPGKSAIASAHFLATAAGHEILAKGGNAFDAAIAVSSVLSVVEQSSTGIGGGALMVCIVHQMALRP